MSARRKKFLPAVIASDCGPDAGFTPGEDAVHMDNPSPQALVMIVDDDEPERS
jgi:hypothetical protein